MMKLNPNFEQAAQKVLQQSIRSALCVDNDFVEPYHESTTGEDFDTPKKLYKSFRKVSCNLDVYKFSNYTNWSSNKRKVFGNKDLLVLDWYLDSAIPTNFNDALKILREGVNNPGLSFIVIYTATADIMEVEYQIKAYLGGHSTSKFNAINKIITQLNGKLNNDFEALFDCIKELCKEYLLLVKRRKDTLIEIRKKIKSELGSSDEFNNFNSVLKHMLNEAGLSYHDFILQLGYRYNCPMKNKNNDCWEIKTASYKGYPTFTINNTFVSIFLKKVSTDEIYTNFLESIYKPPQNFTTLLTLELRDIYRQNISIMGKKLMGLNEFAFFHHRKNSNEESFHEFIQNNWKDDISSFHMERKPEILKCIDEYKRLTKLDENLKDHIKKDRKSFLKELIRLNYAYSFMQINKRKYPLNFGDMFLLMKNKKDENSEEFILCITPLCDCLRSEENIKNHFHFVRGAISNNDKALHAPESNHYSFFVKNRKPLCIRWNRHPFTINIQNKVISQKDLIQIELNGKKFIRYMDTLKENYTQRIANASFSNAMRVGIELARIEQDVNTNILKIFASW